MADQPSASHSKLKQPLALLVTHVGRCNQQTNTLETQSGFFAVSACSCHAAQCLNSKTLNASFREANDELTTERRDSKQRLLQHRGEKRIEHANNQSLLFEAHVAALSSS